MRTKFYFLAALTLIVFNIWHSLNRGVWNGSIRDSLTMGPNVIELAQKTDPRIRIRKQYDGQFFYAMTFDPLLLTRETLSYVDTPVYRYRRMLYPLLGYVFALGQRAWFPYSLFFVNVTAWFLIGFFLWKVGRLEGLPAMTMAVGGMAVSGLVFATFRSLCDTLAACLVIGGCYFWRKKDFWGSALLLALAGLAREVSVVVPVSIFIYSIFKKDGSLKKQIGFISIAILPALLWMLYLRMKLPHVPDPAGQLITFPFWGLLQETWISWHREMTTTERIRSISINVETALLMGFVLVRFWKFPTFWGALCLGQVVFLSLLRGDIWIYHASSARVVALLTLFCLIWFLELDRRRRVS
ncbi:MAG: hypothetical protein LHV69_02975 [Elusimicrobia bacterium]|nr:hypothetical protein [Candidatus Obscuribacterium magneticum]